MVEGGSFHLAAPGSIPGVSTQPTRLGVQGCGGVHSTLTAGIIRVKGPLVVTCILRFATLGQVPNVATSNALVSEESGLEGERALVIGT